jgi:transcriptional regulator with XRE-family HTH domain
MIDIGLEVKILRERLKVSAKELAERIGLSQSQISRLEKGQRRIDTKVLARISEALGVDPSHFFREAEVPPTEDLPPPDAGPIGRQIRTLRRRLHLSADEVAERVGVTKARLQNIEDGKRDLEPEIADKLCRVLRVPANHFLVAQAATIRRLEAQVARLDQALAEGRRSDVETAIQVDAARGRAVPIISDVVTGYPTRFSSEGDPVGGPLESIYLPGLHDPGAFALHVIGDSMVGPIPPSFREGDIVVFTRRAVKSQDFALVRLAGDELVFRQVFFDAGAEVRLQPLHLVYRPRTLPRDEILAMWRLAAHVSAY